MRRPSPASRFWQIAKPAGCWDHGKNTGLVLSTGRTRIGPTHRSPSGLLARPGIVSASTARLPIFPIVVLPNGLMTASRRCPTAKHTGPAHGRTIHGHPRNGRTNLGREQNGQIRRGRGSVGLKLRGLELIGRMRHGPEPDGQTGNGPDRHGATKAGLPSAGRQSHGQTGL